MVSRESQASLTQIGNKVIGEPSGEHPFDVYIVVADDEIGFRNQTKAELEAYLSGYPNIRSGLAFPTSTRKLLTEAVKGNAGKAADIVLLDQMLEHRRNNWAIHGVDLQIWARNKGIPFPNTKNRRKVPEGILEQIFYFNHFSSDGPMLALLLRSAGYTGYLGILSNTGRGISHMEIRIKRDEFLESVPDLVLRTPIIDRVLSKVGFTGINEAINPIVRNALPLGK